MNKMPETDILSPEVKEIVNRMSKCISAECYLYNLAIENLDSYGQTFHLHEIEGLRLAALRIDVTIYVHHENDMSNRKIDYYTFACNDEIVIKVNDFERSI